MTTPSEPIIVDLPPVFYDDHVARELPAGRELKRTKRLVTVQLSLADFDELMNDAEHYAHADGPSGYDGETGLRASARATIKRLTAALEGRGTKPAFVHHPVDRTLGDHVIVLKPGDTFPNLASTNRPPIYGPAVVRYRAHADGGIDAEVEYDERTEYQRKRDQAVWNSLYKGPSPLDEVQSCPGWTAREIAEAGWAYHHGWLENLNRESALDALERCARFEGGAR